MNDEDLVCELIDECGLREAQAEAVAEWHATRVQAEVQAVGGTVVSAIVGFILGKGESRVANARLRALGLAYAAGLNVLAGYPSMTAAAEAEGCSPKALSLVAAEAANVLGLPSGSNRKAPR